MALYKNQANQKIAVYAHDTSADEAKTGDAANITAQISLDGAATAATNDTNPTELDATDAPGIYLFDMTQAESNADLVVLCAVSSTADVSLEPVIIYTLPGSNAGVSADAVAISGDSTAADNLEAAADGTGYNLGGGSVVAASVTGAVGSVTGNVGGVAGTINTLDALDTAQDSQHGTTQSAIAALNDLSAAQVNAEVDSALADYDGPTNAEMEARTLAAAEYATAAALATVDANVDSVLDDTGTSGVVLADDAITAAKYDQTTAYPLASADSGATQVARTGADGDTLETLSDQIDAVPTTSEIWAALDATTKNAIADAVISRGMANVEDTAEALSIAEMAFAMFESKISGTTWTIYKSDHATPFSTRTVTTDASAEAITEVT